MQRFNSISRSGIRIISYPSTLLAAFLIGLLACTSLPAEEAEPTKFDRSSVVILGGSGIRSSRVDADVQRLSRDLFLRDILAHQASQDPVENLIIYREINNRPEYKLDAASFAFMAYGESSGFGVGIGIDHYHNQRYGPIPGYVKILDSMGLPPSILRFTGLQPFCDESLRPFCRAKETYLATPHTIPYFSIEYRYEPVDFLAFGLGLGLIPYAYRYSQAYAYVDLRLSQHHWLQIRARAVELDGEKRYPKITTTRRANSVLSIFQVGVQTGI